MLLQMGLLLRLGPNVVTDIPLLCLGPKVITDGTFITLGSIYYTCAFYRMTEEKESGETKDEYQNKRKGCEKLLEIYLHLHQQVLVLLVIKMDHFCS